MTVLIIRMLAGPEAHTEKMCPTRPGHQRWLCFKYEVPAPVFEVCVKNGIARMWSTFVAKHALVIPGSFVRSCAHSFSHLRFVNLVETMQKSSLTMVLTNSILVQAQSGPRPESPDSGSLRLRRAPSTRPR